MELQQEKCWPPQSQYVLCRGTAYFIRKHARRDCSSEVIHWQCKEQCSWAALLLCSSVGVFSCTIERVWQMCIIMHSNNWCILKWAARVGRRETMHLFRHLPVYYFCFTEKQLLIYAHLHKRKRLWRCFCCKVGQVGPWSTSKAHDFQPLNYSAVGKRSHANRRGTLSCHQHRNKVMQLVIGMEDFQAASAKLAAQAACCTTITSMTGKK